MSPIIINNDSINIGNVTEAIMGILPLLPNELNIKII